MGTAIVVSIVMIVLSIVLGVCSARIVYLRSTFIGRLRTIENDGWTSVGKEWVLTISKEEYEYRNRYVMILGPRYLCVVWLLSLLGIASSLVDLAGGSLQIVYIAPICLLTGTVLTGYAMHVFRDLYYGRAISKFPYFQEESIQQ